MIRFLSVVGLVAVSAVAYLYKKGCEVSKKEEGYNGAEVDLSKERKKGDNLWRGGYLER
jgi:hypothetical protein